MNTTETMREDAHPSAQTAKTAPGSPPGRFLRRVAPRWPFATIAALTAGVFWPALIGGKSFSVVPSFQTATYPWAALATDLKYKWPQSDQAESSYPWTAFIGRTLREAHIPLWDPQSFGGGSPLFSNGLSAVLYPPQIVLRAVFSAATAHDLFVVLHIFLAGVFTLMLLRRLGVSRLGGTVGAVSWMFGSCTMAWIQLEMMTQYFALLPLGLYCVDRAVRDRSWRWVVIAGWALALELSSGNLLVMLLAILTALAYGGVLALVDVLGEGFAIRPAMVALGRLGLICVVAGFGAAIVAVPTYLTLGDAGRAAYTYDQLQRTFLMPWSTFKYLWTAPVHPVLTDKPVVQMYEMLWYGLAPMLLATVGLVAGRGRAGWLGRGCVVIAGGIAVGTPLTWLAYHLLPGFDSLQPYGRLIFVIGFGVCLLAGEGVDVLTRALRWLMPRFLAWARVRPGRGFVRVVAVAAGLALVSWTALPLISYGMSMNPPFVDNATHPQYPDTPAILALRAAESGDPWGGLVVPVAVTGRDGSLSLAPLTGATALVPGINTFGGYDSSAASRTSIVVKLMTGVPLATAMSEHSYIVHPTFTSADVRWDLLLNYGVDYIFASPRIANGDPGNWGRLGSPAALQLLYDGPDGRIYKVPHAASGPYVTGSQSVVPDSASALRLFTSPDHDPRKLVVLEQADLAAMHLRPLQSGAPQIRRMATARTNNSIQVQVTSDRPGWLVVPENYDQGWSAQVGGVDAPVVRADYSRMAVQIPAGSSTVELKYRPPGLQLGLGLLMIAVLISAIVLLPGVLRGRRPLPDLLRGRPSVRRRLGGRSNSFGLLRLVFASLVLVTHAFPLTGRGDDPMWVWTQGQESLAGIAVGSFFAISGYLVTRSAMSGGVVRFAWFRALRIFPAFWACLVVTAFLIGPMLWALDGRGMGSYFSFGSASPFGYIYKNITLVINQYGIWNLLQATTPYGRTTGLSILNGSLWTLIYEFRCYLIVAALLLVGVITRRRVVVPLLTAGLWLVQLVHQVLPGVAARLPSGLSDPQAVWLTLVFLLAACIALYADDLPMNDWLGASAAVVWLGTLLMGGYQVVGLVMLPYLVLWLAARLPVWFHRVGAVNDYSYGIYIYGFLAEQCLARFGASSWPLLVFLVASAAASFVPAWVSWHLLEKHALRLKHWGPGVGGKEFTYGILALMRRDRVAVRAVAQDETVSDTDE